MSFKKRARGQEAESSSVRAGVAPEDERSLRAWGADLILEKANLLGVCPQAVTTAQSIYQQCLSGNSLLELDARLAAMTATLLAYMMHETQPGTNTVQLITQAYTRVLATRGKCLLSVSSPSFREALITAEFQVLQSLGFSLGGAFTLLDNVTKVLSSRKVLQCSSTFSATYRQATLLAHAAMRTQLPAIHTPHILAVGIVYMAGSWVGSPLPADLLPTLGTTEQEVMLIAHELFMAQKLVSPRFIDFCAGRQATPLSKDSTTGTWRGPSVAASASHTPFWMLNTAAAISPSAMPEYQAAAVDFGAEILDSPQSFSSSPGPSCFPFPAAIPQPSCKPLESFLVPSTSGRISSRGHMPATCRPATAGPHRAGLSGSADGHVSVVDHAVSKRVIDSGDPGQGRRGRSPNKPRRSSLQHVPQQTSSEAERGHARMRDCNDLRHAHWTSYDRGTLPAIGCKRARDDSADQLPYASTYSRSQRRRHW